MTPEDIGFSTERLDRIGELSRSYVDSGRLPCAQVTVTRYGQTVYQDTYGKADIEADVALREDAIFRIYSMTKPIVSIALMQLYEQGLILLENPISRFIPEFADTEVWVSGDEEQYTTRPPTRPIGVKDLLTHTSGLTYGFQHVHTVDALYRRQKLGDLMIPPFDLAEGVRRLAGMPLLFDPGTGWNYSMSTDVCGRIVEIVSGRPLDEYLREHVFEPLGMSDTDFRVRAGQEERFTANYIKGPDGALMQIDARTDSHFLEPPTFLGGGGGLVSTTADYLRFCNCLLNGGELDGARVIGRKTLEYMRRNHLPDGRNLNEMGQHTFSEISMEGMGFGLGFSVVEDAAANAAVCSEGEFAWGGAATTVFWVDPVEDLAVVFMTQFMPSNHYPVRRQLKAAVYQALVD